MKDKTRGSELCQTMGCRAERVCVLFHCPPELPAMGCPSLVTGNVPHPYPHRDLYPGGSVGLGRGILQRVCILSTPRN